MVHPCWVGLGLILLSIIWEKEGNKRNEREEKRETKEKRKRREKKKLELELVVIPTLVANQTDSSGKQKVSELTIHRKSFTPLLFRYFFV